MCPKIMVGENLGLRRLLSMDFITILAILILLKKPQEQWKLNENKFPLNLNEHQRID